MDWHLLLDYINALKWVVFATLVLVLFRTSLGRLIDRLTKFEGFGAKANFEQQAAEVAHRVKQLEAGASVESKVAITTGGEVTTSQGDLAIYVEKEEDLVHVALQMRKGRQMRVALNRALDADETRRIMDQIGAMAVATDYGFDYNADRVIFLIPGASLL